MNQPGSTASGIFGHGMGSLGAIQLRPQQSGSYQDGSLGAIQLQPQPGSYQNGSLGAVAQPGVFQNGSLGDEVVGDGVLGAMQIGGRKVPPRRIEAGKYLRGMGMTAQEAMLAAQNRARLVALENAKRSQRRPQSPCVKNCLMLYGKSPMATVCRSQCKPISGLGILETVPKWALYAGGAAVLGAGYFLFFKKKR